MHAWINYNISICEKLSFGLHLILNMGYDLTIALGKCLMGPSSSLWHYSGLTSGKVYPFPHSCNHSTRPHNAKKALYVIISGEI